MPSVVIVLALFGVALFAITATAWSARPSEDDPASAGRPGWRGNAVGVLVSLGVVGGVLSASRLEGWNRDRALWVSVGGFLALMTVVRPSWFWENYRARWLRGLIGDGPTAVIYLALAALMVWIGINTDWTFGRRYVR